MRITHLGHACLLVETGGARVLIDPGVFSHGFEELSDLTAVLITHQHPDHIDSSRLVPLLETNDQARLIAEPEIATELGKVGVTAEALHTGQDLQLESVTLTGVGGIHAEIHPDIPRVGNIGMLLTADGEPTFLHPGDSYEAVPEGVDVLALPLNAPWAKVSETITFERAIAPKALFPVHDGLLQPAARGVYLTHVRNLAPEGTEILDLTGAGPATL